jgi:Putative DNA-binding domain
MPTLEELQPLLGEPREDLAAEYKTWLNLTINDHKAVLAKAAIALANHGGGFIVIGFDDQGHQLASVARPADVPQVSQDEINAAIRRFATPDFHCELYNVPHPATQALHPIIVIPGNITEPVMSKRDCANVISQNRCYIRKPGPRSEEPMTAEEWRTLLRRCVLAGREDMLEAIRSIVSGRVETAPLVPNARDDLHSFVEAARIRWAELVDVLPEGAPARFPLGHYEMAFSLVGAQSAPNLVELQRRLEHAQRIRLTGWSVFLNMGTPGWTPYPHDDFVEAWVGRPIERERNFDDPAHADFWRVSRDGKLYTIRGYTEDGRAERVRPGASIDVTLPVWRVGEGLLFAARLAETFEDVEAIAVECRFTGLNNRFLTSLSGARAIFNDRVSRTPEVAMTVQVTLDQVRDNLTEVIHQLISPLYERFDFFPLSIELVDGELGRLRGGRF